MFYIDATACMQHGRPECTRSSLYELGSVGSHAMGTSNLCERSRSDWN